MSETRNHANDDDLLASAIPIDSAAMGEDEDLPEAEPIEEDDELAPIDLADAETEESMNPDDMTSTRIQMFGPQTTRHADNWNRTPNATGTGAIHVKTFVAKLRLDAIDHLDEQVNEWLDAHPEYEVKFVTTSIGKLIGKISEDAIFMNVWV